MPDLSPELYSRKLYPRFPCSLDVGGAVQYDGVVTLEKRNRRKGQKVVPFSALAVFHLSLSPHCPGSPTSYLQMVWFAGL